MPKVVVMSDIHGNLTALKAVWEELQQRSPAHTIVLGDLVAFGPQPRETLEFLDSVVKPSLSIRGNTDRYILEEVWKDGEKSGLDEAVLQSLEWTADQIGDEGRAILESLSTDATYVVEDFNLYACHGTPDNDDLGIMAETAEELLPSLDSIEADALLCGHSHIPYRTCRGNLQVFNVGSVGLPFDRDFRSCYLSFLVGDGALREVTFCRVPYNLSRPIALLEQCDMPGSAIPIHRLRTSRMTEPKLS